MRVNQTSNEIEYVYDSVSEIAAVGLKNLSQYLHDRELSEEWHGVGSPKEARKLASEGWLSEADTALCIATDAIDSVEREHRVASFSPVWDVTGCEIDVARYLANQPENMIDYEVMPTTRSGRVIVLCASVSYSCGVSVDNIKRRGHGIAALAFALSKLGFATELWADMSAESRDGATIGRIRVQVKGPNDALDPALIMFAYSHPAMLRTLLLPAMHAMPSQFQHSLRVGKGYGTPVNPKQDLPEGTIYLPSVRSKADVPEAKETLLRYLRELGIVEN